MWLAVAMVASLLTAEPGADPALEQARAHVGAARDFYQAKKFKDALQEFLAAQKLKPKAALWFNIGRCYEAVGDYPQALRAFREYLREEPSTPEHDALIAGIKRMEKKLRARGVQQLLVVTDPEGAEVFVDGHDLGASPATFELPPGAHQVAAEKQGFKRAERGIQMSSDSSLQIELVLREDAPPPPPVVRREEPPPDAPTRHVELVPAAPPPLPVVVAEAPRAPSRKLTWVAAGTAAVGLAAGAGMGFAATSARGELLSTAHSEAQANDLEKRTNSMALGANIGFGVAAAAGVTALVLFFVEGSGS